MLISLQESDKSQKIKFSAQVSNTKAEAGTSDLALGPVEGSLTGAVAVKSVDYPLPQNALVSCLLPVQSQHPRTSIQASRVISRSLLQCAVL